MKAIICGGRDYHDSITALRVLNNARNRMGLDHVIEGGANGADKLARQWAQTYDIPCTTIPADWAKHGKAAGPIRNRAMLKESPDCVIAFPGGKGTRHMMKVAQEAGVRVILWSDLA